MTTMVSEIDGDDFATDEDFQNAIIANEEKERPTTLRLLSSRILVKPDKPLDKIGSIIIPDSAKKPVDMGRVVAMGPGMLMNDGGRWPMPPVSIGDHVIYDARNPFVKVKLNGEELIQLRDDDLYAVLED